MGVFCLFLTENKRRLQENNKKKELLKFNANNPMHNNRYFLPIVFSYHSIFKGPRSDYAVLITEHA